MFFLFRCLFWLGLVFSQIATQEGADAIAVARQTASLGQSGLAQAALDAAGRTCAATPEKCLALAAQAARLTQETPAASRDSLKPGDRALAWRLRSGKALDATNTVR